MVSQDAHILDDKEAMKLWSREYAKGWEIKIQVDFYQNKKV